MKNQIKHVWSILAQSSTTDSVTNLFSLTNTIDELTVNFNPKDIKSDQKDAQIAVPVSFQIVTLWKRNNNLDFELKNQVRISLIDPKGKELQKIEYPMVIPADKMRMRFITPVNGLNVTTSGEYRFVIMIKELGQATFKQEAEVPIDVVINKSN